MEITVLEASGLTTDPNQLSSVSAGNVISCTNLSCDKENIYEKTRGYRTYATLSGLVSKFFEYQGKTLVYYLKNGTTQTLAYNIAGTITDYGTIESTYPMFAMSANSNFYFTSNDGIKKLDSVASTIQNAGVPQGLGGAPTLITATTGNVLQNGYQTAYRIVWGYTDANNNLILGAPSPRVPVVNSSGATKDVSLVIQIPDQITNVKYFYQIYRAEEVVVATIPLDEMYLVNQITLTSTDITNGYVTFDDHVSVDNLGATIYTAPSQQGIENSYYQPPFAKDIGEFEGTAFYANTKTKQIILLTLKQVQATGFGYFSFTADSTSGSYILTNVSDTSSVQIGQLITGVDINLNTYVLGKTATTITMSLPAFGTTVGMSVTIRDFIKIGSEYYYAADTNDASLYYFNVNTDIETATINFTNLVNDLSLDYNAYYLGIGDIDRGMFEIEALTFGSSAFTISSSQPTAFISNLPQTSTNEVGGNRLYLSLNGLPESVPAGNWVAIGTAEYAIQRILFLRSSFFIFKEDGSVYKGVGSTIDSISIRRLNSNAKLRGIQLPAVLDNNIFCFTDQGVSVISENSIDIISKDIERTLFAISKTRNTSFEDVSFGISYESDRKYIMFVTTNSTDTVATQAFVYNVLTKRWTRWQRDASFGFWNVSEDRLYLATDIMKQERKDYQNTDFSEDETDVSIVNVNGTTIELDVVVTIGWTLYQDGIKSVITAVNGTTVTVSQSLGFVIGSAKVYEPMAFDFTYVPQPMKNLIETKHNRELFHYVQNVDFKSFSQTISNEDQSTSTTDAVVPKSSALAIQPIRSFVPMNQARSHWLNIKISQEEACTNIEYLGYAIIADTVSERSK